MQKETMIVKVILGETSEREFFTRVTNWYTMGDYYNPCVNEYDMDGGIWDSEGVIMNKLIERYESIFKVDLGALAIEAFNDELT